MGVTSRVIALEEVYALGCLHEALGPYDSGRVRRAFRN